MHIVYVKCVLSTELGSVVRTAIRQGGVTSLWQGLGPSLLRDVPFSGKKNFRVISFIASSHSSQTVGVDR